MSRLIPSKMRMSVFLQKWRFTKNKSCDLLSWRFNMYPVFRLPQPQVCPPDGAEVDIFVHFIIALTAYLYTQYIDLGFGRAHFFLLIL